MAAATIRWLLGDRCSRFPLRNVDALDEKPYSQRDCRESHRQKKDVRRIGRRQDQREVPHDKPETGDREEDAENFGNVARSKDQVTTENGGDPVAHHEHPTTISISLEREKRGSTELSRPQSAQIAGAPQRV